MDDPIIEAGAAFGSGAHPSTLLALVALGAVVESLPTDARILDYGCGSGILLLAAARLPHRQLVGADNAAESVVTARRNLERNGVAAELLRAERPDHPAIVRHGPYRLILANLLTELHVPFVGKYARLLAPGGAIILSGILRWQAEALVEAAGATGLRLERRFEHDDWCALLLRPHVKEADPQIDVSGEEGEERGEP